MARSLPIIGFFLVLYGGVCSKDLRSALFRFVTGTKDGESFSFLTETNIHSYDIVKSLHYTVKLNKLLDEITPSPLALEYQKKIDKLIGPLPQPGEYSREGIFNVVIQAYHTRIINDQAVHQTRKYGQNLTDEEINARSFQRKLKTLADNENRCREYLEDRRRYWVNESYHFLKAVELINKTDDEQLIPECSERKLNKTEEVLEYTLKAYNSALFITLLQIDLMVDFDRYTVNGRKPRWEAPFGPLHRMLKDTDESLNAIEAGLEEMRKRRDEANQPNVAQYWEGLLKNFTDKLVSPPYDKLYGGGTLTKSTEIIDSARRVWEDIKKATVKFREFRQYFQYYKIHYTIYKKDFQNPKLEAFYTLVQSVYDKYLKVKRVGDGTKSGTLDPDWDFDLSNPLHKLRVGWDYLDSVAEEMKCHLRTTYWFDLRNETLKKTQTQFDRNRVFGHFSRTLYQPCRATETDLVAQCNPVNYEICRSTFPTIQQERHVQLTGDLSFYRPKWVYRRTELAPPGIESKCEGEKTWIIPLSLCRCGFRLECGTDIGEELSCPFQENDNLRKQCKGSVGYPCKSLPFAKGRHDISCVTGYCDMTMNSCEWDPPSQNKK